MTRPLTLLAALLFAPVSLAADCPEPVEAYRVQATLTAAEGAYGRNDHDGVLNATDKARAQLLCVQEQITPSLAAQIHRVEGFFALVADKPKRSAMAFAAARTAEPSYTLPASVAPEGDRAHDQYRALAMSDTTEPLPNSRYGTLFVNGKVAKERSTEVPSVLQILDRSGVHSSVEYLWPTDPTTYVAGGSRTPTQNVLLFGGSGVAVAGLALIGGGLAATSQASDKGPFTLLDQGPQRGAYVATGGTLMAAGIGGIVTSFLVKPKDR